MKLGVCVPYRNREAHLKEFIPHVGKYLEHKKTPTITDWGFHLTKNKPTQLTP